MKRRAKNPTTNRKPRITLPQATIWAAVIVAVIGFIGTIIVVILQNDEPKQEVNVNGGYVQAFTVNSTVNINLVDENAPISPGIYQQYVFAKNHQALFSENGTGYFLDLYNIKFLLPDGQVAYIKELPYNTTKGVAYCTANYEECHVLRAFKSVIPEDEICTVITPKEAYTVANDHPERCAKMRGLQDDEITIWYPESWVN